jgi:hypothetical protein
MGIVVSEPRKPLKFNIKPEDVSCAKRKNPCHCVIAKAFLRQFNENLLEIQVFATLATLTYSGGRIHRYEVPEDLRKGLERFDSKKGGWNLPPGDYQLNPLPDHKTQKMQRARARKRRELGDENMDRKYPMRKKHKIRTNDRVINLVKLRRLEKI